MLGDGVRKSSSPQHGLEQGFGIVDRAVLIVLFIPGQVSGNGVAAGEDVFPLQQFFQRRMPVEVPVVVGIAEIKQAVDAGGLAARFAIAKH